jgi:hypothetical protein
MQVVKISRGLQETQPDLREQQVSMPVVTCRVLTGKSKGRLYTMIPSRFHHGLDKNSRDTPFERIQLPIKLAFAMTVDKAQGSFTLTCMDFRVLV